MRYMQAVSYHCSTGEFFSRSNKQTDLLWCRVVAPNGNPVYSFGGLLEKAEEMIDKAYEDMTEVINDLDDEDSTRAQSDVDLVARQVVDIIKKRVKKENGSQLTRAEIRKLLPIVYKYGYTYFYDENEEEELEMFKTTLEIIYSQPFVAGTVALPLDKILEYVCPKAMEKDIPDLIMLHSQSGTKYAIQAVDEETAIRRMDEVHQFRAPDEFPPEDLAFLPYDTIKVLYTQETDPDKLKKLASDIIQKPVNEIEILPPSERFLKETRSPDELAYWFL